MRWRFGYVFRAEAKFTEAIANLDDLIDEYTQYAAAQDDSGLETEKAIWDCHKRAQYFATTEVVEIGEILPNETSAMFPWRFDVKLTKAIFETKYFMQKLPVDIVKLITKMAFPEISEGEA